jgi:hypothetical protein
VLGGRASVHRWRRGAGCRGVRLVQRRLRRRNGVVWGRGFVSGVRRSSVRIRRHRRCIVNWRPRRGLNRIRRCIVNRSLRHYPGSRRCLVNRSSRHYPGSLRCLVNRSLRHHPGSRRRPGDRRGRGCNPGRRRRRSYPWGRGRGERRRDAPGERTQRNCGPARQHDKPPTTTTKPRCATHRALLLSSSGRQIACHLPRKPACPLASAGALPGAAVGTLQQTLCPQRSVDSHVILLSAERLRLFGIRADPSVLRHPVLSDTANCEVA